MFYKQCRSVGRFYGLLTTGKNSEFLRLLPTIFDIARNDRAKAKDLPYIQEIMERNKIFVAKSNELDQLQAFAKGELGLGSTSTNIKIFQ